MSPAFGLFPTEQEGIFRIKVPVPYPLRWVNSYLIRGVNGFTVLDPGIHTAEAVGVWESVWRELGSDYREVERIVLTHHHPDHYGLAGLFQEKSGAPVYLSELGLSQAARLWGGGRTLTEELWQLFQSHGMDPLMKDEMIGHMEGFVPLVSPQPKVTVLRAGELIRLGDVEYEAVETAGHASGHFSFYRAASKVMFCGDHVLPMISPNVSYIPGVDEDPLQSYLTTLEAIARYPVTLAFPGHRDPFVSFRERCGELIHHHDQRLAAMKAEVETAGTMTAYELSIKMFGTRLTIHQMRFALSETIAHLIRLERSGQIRREDQDGLVTYRAI